MSKERYHPVTRVLTGRPNVVRAYVLDKRTGKMVSACSHNHVAKNGRNGAYFAELCARQQLRSVLLSEEEKAP